ncbi:unnamed protein product [Brassica oleracea]
MTILLLSCSLSVSISPAILGIGKKKPPQLTLTVDLKP